MPKQTRLAHPFLRKDSWTLWEWWVLATVVGIFMGIAIVAAASVAVKALGIVNTAALLHIVGALEGAALGLAQWLVLRRYIKRIYWWIVATAIGAIAAWLIGLKAIVVLILIFLDGGTVRSFSPGLLPAVFWLGAWVGTILGLAQWFVIRTHVRQGFLWVLVNALAWGLGLLTVFTGANFVTPGEFTLETAFIGLIAGATTGCVIGAITGIGLVWLLKPRLLRHH